MFPLGTVLFPGMGLPLRVFEPRYRAMMEVCMAGDRRFGVVLIERGSEVGGGDLRTDIGTMAEIVRADRTEDGRWFLGAVGTERIRVVRWLEDDPYPRAEVEAMPDHPDPDLAERLSGVVARLRAVLAVAAELGLRAPPATVELSDEPSLALYQACALAPLGSFDRQRLLTAEGAAARAELLAEMLAEQEELLRARLA